MLKSLLRKFDTIAVEAVVVVFIAVFVLLYFSPNIFYDIPSGHVGVLWRRFDGGTVTTPGEFLPEGLHMIWPWDKIYIYDARLQKRSQTLHVLAADGLRLELDVVYRYRINKADVGLLQKYAGQHWASILLAPSIAAKTRDIVSQDTPSEIYSTRRLEIQHQIREDVSKELYNHFNPEGARFKTLWIVLEDVLIRSVTPPPEIEQAIMRKYEARQNEEEYDFRLMAAAKEAQRKKIEAEGIKEFQDIVSPGITESYLRLRGIEATQALASSKNAKIVIFGNNKSGLPLILGNLDTGKSGSVNSDAGNAKRAPKVARSHKTADAGQQDSDPIVLKAGPGAAQSSFDESGGDMDALRRVLRKVGIPVSAPRGGTNKSVAGKSTSGEAKHLAKNGVKPDTAVPQ